MLTGRRLMCFRRLLSMNNNGIVYTRQLLQKLSVDVQVAKQQQLVTKQQTLQKQLKRLAYNDNNPANHIQVKINHPLLFGDKLHVGQLDNPYIIVPTPRPERRMISAHKKYIKTSLKKMKVALYNIKKIHVTEAIYILLQSQKKVAKALLPTFFNLIDHAKRRGFTPYRLFVHGLILGKTRRYRGLRYHAKGKGNPQKTDMCQVKIILYEMPKDEFFKKVANGQIPASLGQQIKQQLIKKNSSFEDVRKYRHMLTSQGRQQLRQFNRRRIYKQLRQNAEKGVFVPAKIIEKELLESQMEKYQELLENLSSRKSTLKLRQALFKKNTQS